MSTVGLDRSGPTFAEVAVGDELPTLVLPITRTLIVSGAIASRDYQDVHHDSVLAKERGSKDIFMNILTTNGLVGRYVTDWSGPRSRLSDVNIRLGAPNYPDCTMTLTGSVTEKGPLSDDGDVRRRDGLHPRRQRPGRPRHRHGHAVAPPGRRQRGVSAASESAQA